MSDDDELIKCPECGKEDTMDGFDVMGADDNNIFCTDCHCEFDPSSGVIAPFLSEGGGA